MANTYVLIASNTVGAGGVTSVVFSSIPQTYTDLLLKMSVRTDRSDSALDYVYIRPNGSSSSLSMRRLYAVGTTVGSDTQSYIVTETDGGLATSSTFANDEVYIPNYTSSNYKSFSIDGVYENNSSTANQLALSAGLWSNTSAITSITLIPAAGPNIVQYSNFYLYGIKNS